MTEMPQTIPTPYKSEIPRRVVKTAASAIGERSGCTGKKARLGATPVWKLKPQSQNKLRPGHKSPQRGQRIDGGVLRGSSFPGSR
jgi:hypothetical protein